MSIPVAPPYWHSSFAGIHFGIELDLTTGVLPEWSTPERRWAVLELMGGGIVRQLLGTGPSQVTYGIEVETDADVRALMAAMLTGTASDLVMYEGSTWQAGVGEVVAGAVLERFDGCYLIDLAPVERAIDGESRWLATFERAVSE
jgi:hypothetical protein